MTRPKRLIPLLLLILVLIILLIYLFNYSANRDRRWIGFNNDLPVGSQAVVTVTRSDLKGIELHYSFPGVWATDIKLDGHVFSQLSGEGFGLPSRQGLPNIPLLRHSIIIPQDAVVTAKVLDANYKEYNLAELQLKTLAPLQPQQEKTPEQQQPFQFDEMFYHQDQHYPAQPTTLENEHTLRGRRLIHATTSPLIYNPAKQTLRLYSELSVRIDFMAGNIDSTRDQWLRHYSPDFENYFDDQVLNYWSVYDQLGISIGDIASRLRINYLIILGDDSFYEPMLPFVALKESEHFTVTMLRLSELIPNAASLTELELKNALLQQVRTIYSTDNKPSHMLLVGDRDKIPTWVNDERTGTDNTLNYFWTDLYYACMDDLPDWHPDIRYGRLPVDNATELSWLVDKYLAYAALNGNEAWLKHASLIATCDAGHYGEVELAHSYVLSRTSPRGYIGNFPAALSEGGDRLFCQGHNATENDLKAMLNEGRGYVIYSGHGSTVSWQDYDFYHDEIANNIPNAVYPFVISHACYTGQFKIPYTINSMGRAWVLQQDKGAIASFGPAYFTGWDEDNIIELGMNEEAFPFYPYAPSGYRNTPSRMRENGMASLEAIKGEGYAQHYRESYNLFGDPSLLLWFQGWNSILNADFIGTLSVDLLFYDQARQEAYIYTTDKTGTLSKVGYGELKAGDWGLARSGNFHADTGSELLMFDNKQGRLGLFSVDTNKDQSIELLSIQEGLGTDWDHIVTGNLIQQEDAPGFLFLYANQPSAKQAKSALYISQQGKLQKLSERHALPTGIDIISSGHFRANSDATDLFVYDRDTGRAWIYLIG